MSLMAWAGATQRQQQRNCMHACGANASRTPHQSWLLAARASQVRQRRMTPGPCQPHRWRRCCMVQQGEQAAGLTWQPLRRGESWQLCMRREAARPTRSGWLLRLEAWRGRPLGKCRAARAAGLPEGSCPDAGLLQRPQAALLHAAHHLMFCFSSACASLNVHNAKGTRKALGVHPLATSSGA